MGKGHRTKTTDWRTKHQIIKTLVPTLVLVIVLYSAIVVGVLEIKPIPPVEDDFESNNLNSWDQIYDDLGNSNTTMSDKNYERTALQNSSYGFTFFYVLPIENIDQSQQETNQQDSNIPCHPPENTSPTTSNLTENEIKSRTANQSAGSQGTNQETAKISSSNSDMISYSQFHSSGDDGTEDFYPYYSTNSEVYSEPYYNAIQEFYSFYQGKSDINQMELKNEFSFKQQITNDEDNPEITKEKTTNNNEIFSSEQFSPNSALQSTSPASSKPSTPPSLSTLSVFSGLSGYPTSTSQIDAIIRVMDENNLNIYRMSFNPEWFGGKPHPYREDLIQYFLDHCDYAVIVDRNHLYPPTEESAQEARDNWQTVRNSLFEVLETWPNNNRVAVELINEYVSNDFYPRMQELVDSVREAGYTNPIVVNKWNQPWTVINDPLDNTYQGYHFYFNSWSVSGATSQMNTALSRGIKIISTEIGADYNEYRSFTTSTVEETNQFLEWCAERGIGNTVWMNENLDNWPRYLELELSFP